MTLIAVYDKNGCLGRCDARCYDAKHENCDCICGGRNHGKGKGQAIENTREQEKDLIEELTESEKQIERLFFSEQINQLSLFYQEGQTYEQLCQNH